MIRFEKGHEARDGIRAVITVAILLYTSVTLLLDPQLNEFARFGG